MVLKENRLKLTRVAGIETVEVIKTETAGPVVKWTDLAGFPCRCVVILADPRRRVAVCRRISDTVPALLGMMPV